MSSSVRRFYAVLCLAIFALSAWADTPLPKPPATRTDNVTETLHGVSITDPYRWLEDQNAPATRAWIDEQNAYTRSLLSAFPGKDAIRRQLEQLMRIDSIGAPRLRGGRYFYTKRRADQNLDIIYMREKSGDQEIVLLDPSTLSADGSVSASLVGISEDGTLVAFGIRKGGADEVSITLFDVNTRRQLQDDFPSARYGPVQFTPDRKAFYYTVHEPKTGSRVYLHTIGADPKTDKELFGKAYGPGESVGVTMSPDGRYLVYTVHFGSAAEKVEVYFQDVKNNGPIIPVVNDIKADFSPHLAGDHLFLETNWEAPNGRVFDVDLKNPARANWKLIIPESKYPLQSVSAIGGKLFATYLENVATHIRIFEPSGKFVKEVPVPQLGNGSISGRWEQDEAIYTFTSYNTPRAIYRYSVSTGKQDLWAQIKVPVPTDQIEARQVWYESKDKTRVPMFVIMKKGTALDGTHPALLTGYGGFRIAQTPGFSSNAALWVLNGGIYAVANLRGGSEFGEKWHQDGMLQKKQNVFDDFIAAAEYLIANKYTNSGKLAIQGGSNGGLLMGAMITQRPDLFKAVIVGYPLLDMIRYHKFLIARFWVPEYGSSDDPEQFKILRAYSPYHNVKSGTKYPAIMFVTGDSDTRVAPLHARKMAALLQASTASDNPVLLHYDAKAGHSRGGSVTKAIDDATDQFSFLFWQLGMNVNAVAGVAGK